MDTRMSLWKSCDTTSWDDRTLLQAIHKATASGSVIVLEVALREDAPLRLRILELDADQDRPRVAAPIGIISPEQRTWSSDGAYSERFSGTTTDLLHASPGGLILQGHSEGTHINAAHTIFCGLTNTQETFVDGIEVSGGCSHGPKRICKWQRYQETEIVSLALRLSHQPVVALVCESVSLAYTAWISSVNLVRALATGGSSIGLVGYVEEEAALAVSAKLSRALATGESLAKIALMLNQCIATQEGGAIIVTSQEEGYGGCEIASLSALSIEGPGSADSPEVRATASPVPAYLTSRLTLKTVLTQALEHPDAILVSHRDYAQPTQTLLADRETATWGDQAADWIAECFAHENLLGDAFYIPEILKPADLESQQRATEESCSTCGSTLIQKLGSISGVHLWSEWFCPTCGPLHGGTMNQGYRIRIGREEHAVMATLAGVEPQAHLVAVVRDEARGRWLSSAILHQSSTPTQIELPFSFAPRPVWGFAWIVGIAASSRFFVRMKVWLGPLPYASTAGKEHLL